MHKNFIILWTHCFAVKKVLMMASVTSTSYICKKLFNSFVIVIIKNFAKLIFFIF